MSLLKIIRLMIFYQIDATNFCKVIFFTVENYVHFVWIFSFTASVTCRVWSWNSFGRPEPPFGPTTKVTYKTDTRNIGLKSVEDTFNVFNDLKIKRQSKIGLLLDFMWAIRRASRMPQLLSHAHGTITWVPVLSRSWCIYTSTLPSASPGFTSSQELFSKVIKFKIV